MVMSAAAMVAAFCVLGAGFILCVLCMLVHAVCRLSPLVHPEPYVQTVSLRNSRVRAPVVGV